MASTYTPTGSSNYSDTRFQFISAAELERTNWDIYPRIIGSGNGDGVITIGAGITLTGSENNKYAVYRAMGIKVELNGTFNMDMGTEAQRTAEQRYVARLDQAIIDPSLTLLERIALLHQIMIDRAADAKLNGYADNRKPYFAFEPGDAGKLQIRQSFDEAAISYESDLRRIVGAAIYDAADFANSKEHVLLMSRMWLGGGISAGLKNALSPTTFSHAEAWFEFRYGWREGTGEKAQFNNGWAKRHYKESDYYGLYSGPTAANFDEAKDVYRMFTKHRDDILARENLYPFANANIAQQLISARDILLDGKDGVGGLANSTNADIKTAYQRWAVDNRASFVSTNLYLDPGRASAGDPIDVNSSVNIDASQSSQNSILIGEGGTPGTKGDNLFGGSGNDLLIGGNGDDTLSGGGGINFMAGGEGHDTYVLDAGGTYTIEDKIGTNRVMLDRTVIGRLIRQSDGSYKSDDGKLTANMQGTDLVVFDIDTYTTVTLNADFQSGDFGITLSEAPQITRTITGDLTPIVYGYDGSGNPVYHYDDLGNRITNGEFSIRDDTLYGSSGNDLMQGGYGDDILIGKEGDDRIFADHETTTASAIEHGNNDDGFAFRGDWLAGGAGDDTLAGSRANDVLTGGGGQDLLIGGAGDDELLGDNDWMPYDETWTVAGENPRIFDPLHPASVDKPADGAADTLYGGNGNDHAWGGAGDDVIYGEGGADTLSGNDGGDVIFGGTGDDELHGDQEVVIGGGVVEGDDYIDGEDGNDLITGEGGNDTLFGGAGADTIYGGEGADYLDGEDGDDTLRGGAGNDDLFGGAGNDGLYGNAGENYLDGEDGNDELASDGANSTLFGGAGDDTLFGYGGSSYLDGEEGNNQLVAYLGNNQLQGGAGNDNIWAYGGSNYLDAGDGANYLEAHDGNNEMFGGTGNDTLRAKGTGGNYLDGGDGTNILYAEGGSNQLYGGAGNDTLTATGGNNHLDAGEGINSLYAENGNNTLIAGSGDDTVQAIGDNNTLYAGEGINSLNVNGGNNTLIAGSGDDTLQAMGSNNTLIGGAGNDYFSALGGGNVLLGGEGDDRLYVFGASDGSSIDGGAGSDQLVSDAGGDTLMGGDGNDILWGQGGNDVLDGGAGDDNLYGGEGRDTYIYSRGDGIDHIYDTGTDNILRFGDGISAGDITLRLGSLMLDLCNGDAIHIENFNPDDLINSCTIGAFEFADGTSITAAQLLVQGIPGVGTAGNDTLYSTGSTHTLYGLAGNDSLIGNSGDDTLDGGPGADTMSGSTGNDTYVADNTGDSVIEYPNEGTDIVQSTITYTLPSYVENLTLTGTANISGIGNAFNNVITGNSGNNYLSGENGSDTLDGGPGADVMHGGAGNDTYIVDNALDYVYEKVDDGADTVESNVTYNLPGNVENLTLTGTASINGGGNASSNTIAGNGGNNILNGLVGNDTLSGNSGNDTLNGGDGSDILYGGAGDDTLVGGAGDDTLDGGTGADAMKGNSGNDTYFVDSQGDVVTEKASEGTDTVQSSITYILADNVEKLILAGSVALNGTGNVLDNSIAGNSAANVLAGGAGADTLSGGAGNDTLLGDEGNDSMDGGTGADYMRGGLGDDAYVLDDTGDIVIENAREGTDLVQSSVTYILPDAVENLTLTGTAGINGTGNELDNVIDGNSAVNLLTGLSGNDTYVVDNEGDVVTEQSGEGIDSIISWVSYALPANVENLTLINYGYLNGSGNELDNIITGSNWLNSLDGGSGNDRIYGYAGNDRIDGGAGADIMDGGLGADVYLVDNVDDQVIETRVGLDEGLDYKPYMDFMGTGYWSYSWPYGWQWLNRSEGFRPVDTVYSSVSYTLGSNVEDLILIGTSNLNGTGNELDNVITGNGNSSILLGLGGNDILYGKGGNDLLDGGDGNDTLDGGAGADEMLGGEGDDKYFVDNTGDIVTEALNGGIDTISSAISYTLGANQENLVLTGSSALTGVGNELNNEITGNSANNILDGGAGVDVMRGGAGNDTYMADNADDFIVEGAGGGIDQVISSSDYVLRSAEVENLSLTGNGNLSGTGNGLNNTITGNDGNNVLIGMGGADIINGGSGDDVIYGGDPANTGTGDDGGGAILTHALVDGLGGAADFGENSLARSDDSSTGAIDLTSVFGSSGLNFFGSNWTSFYVNTNGSITFAGPATLYSRDLISGGYSNPIIAPFLADVDTRGGTMVPTPGGNSTGSNLVWYDLDPSSGTVTVTWDDVNGYSAFPPPSNHNAGNAFQLQLVNKGNGNFDIIYRYEDINWLINSNYDNPAWGKGSSYLNAARAGYSAGDKVNFVEMPLAGQANFENVTGNTGQPGVYVYKIRNGATDDTGDTLDGGLGADSLYGGLGNDILIGGAGDDLLDGGVGADTITGGRDNDMLLGGGGNDRYVFKLGDGTDTIIDSQGLDTLFFGNNLTEANLGGIRLDNDMIVNVRGTTDSITLKNWFVQTDGINRIEFADGSFLDHAGIEGLLNRNDAPIVIAPLADQSLSFNKPFSWQMPSGSFADPDEGDVLDYSASQVDGSLLPDWLNFDHVTQTFYGTAPKEIGYVDITVTATDRVAATGSTEGSLSASDSFRISISHGNEGVGNGEDAAPFGQDGNFNDGTGTSPGNPGALNHDNDILQGGAANNNLTDTAGNNLFNGGAGADTLTGNIGNELFIGGTGNDTITTGTGADIIAFNRGDGQDTVVASTGLDNTISLGGGIDYADLSMSKSGNNLILDTGPSTGSGQADQIILQNWYSSTANQSISSLQLVLDATVYDAGSTDPLLNQQVQIFDFAALAQAFDQARTVDPGLTSWALTDSLLSAHLLGSDTAAVGGDLAYQYNLNGTLAGIGLASAQTVINDPAFGTSAQQLHPLEQLQTGTARLG